MILWLNGRNNIGSEITKRFGNTWKVIDKVGNLVKLSTDEISVWANTLKDDNFEVLSMDGLFNALTRSIQSLNTGKLERLVKAGKV